MTDEPISEKRRGQSLADYRLEQVEKKLQHFETLMAGFAAGQIAIKERMTIAVWILVAAGGFFNIISPEILEAFKGMSH